MANSEQLRRNKKQHKPKNLLSKQDDKLIYQAMNDCIVYLRERFKMHLMDYELVYEDSISFDQLIQQIKSKNIRRDFDNVFPQRSIIPDGGVIYLRRKSDDNLSKILVIAETKRQGTNKQRMEEGKKKQAQGNAIERLGKNLIGIRAALNHERITPFVCFGAGCDFEEFYDENSFVMSKLSMMNEFYSLNQIHVWKKDGNAENNFFAPVSLFFREEDWTAEEMFDVLKEVGENSMRYYLF